MNCKYETMEHIRMVGKFIDVIRHKLAERAMTHDASKLESPEAEIFEEYTPKLKGTTYGSDEYKQYLAEMKPALDHHYENNRHHPECHEEGIKNMDLVDIVEMLCDWKAATLRHEDGDIFKSIEINQKRFGYSDELRRILINTATRHLTGYDNER